MQILKELNGKWSSRRSIGVAGATISLLIYIAKFFTEAAQISDTLLIGMFTASVALLAATGIHKRVNDGDV